MTIGKAKDLLNAFLDMSRERSGTIELVKILKSNTYQIGNANVLVRVASDIGKRYFFGLNYIHAEEISNLENSFIAFVCGNLNQIVFIPTEVLVSHLPEISHDRNGEYKINFTRQLELVLTGRKHHLNCEEYVNKWDILTQSRFIKHILPDPVESIHSIIQGRIIEIGNLRGFHTYCPDKSKTFNKVKLSDLARLNTCPELQYTNYSSLRNIDALWFRKTNGDFYPEYAFEVEFSTGVWSGFGRLATLREFRTKLFIVTHDLRKFDQVRNTFPDIRDRYGHLIPDEIALLYRMEKGLEELRNKLGI